MWAKIFLIFINSYLLTAYSRFRITLLKFTQEKKKLLKLVCKQ